MESEKNEVPIWEKYALPLKEAAAYFKIGENKLRRIVDDNKDAEYVLWNSSRPLIKRKKFEDYLDKISSI